ncbi:Lysophospholipase L1 [Granulicatella balaenopterae]|uniref:Lysophospholipase L1 n=1 Tax=Granulicatella balaenopterae TaxID=137733 RepID=A0A1H9P1Z5_9LACT|nr:SGNH/GDSL hydrolase family protein [Granulicatella balaenopterae]SER41839.1 Lysophospholipase L1 [Granulicatella balaenopterae]
MDKKKTILAYGDSNTHGYDADSGSRFSEEERWPELLDQYLGADFSVKEEGLNGRTTVFTDNLQEGRNGLLYLAPAMESHEPLDLVIFMLGTNDCKDRFHLSVEEIAAGMELLVQKAISHHVAWRDGKANILLLVPAPIEEGYKDTDVYQAMGELSLEKSRQLAPLYQEIAKRYHCHFLDVGSIPGIKMNTTDYMHLSSESHQLLALVLAKKISEIFKK